MQLSNYLKIYPYSEEPGYFLLFSTKRASTILLHESVLKSIEEGNLSSDDKETLLSLGFLVTDREEEKRDILSLFDNAFKGIKLSTLMVYMNLDCNLACRYCYEGGMKGSFYMSPETADLLITLIESHFNEGRSVHIDISGGEPLLSIERIKYISERCMSSAKKRGLKYTFNLITNGTLLTKKNVEELTALGLKGAKVTLDGPKENHNLYRPFKSGSGSFDTIIRNIKDACEIITLQIGGNFEQKNYREFPRLLDYLIKEGITPEKISLVKFVPIIKTGGEFGLPEFSNACASINEPWLFEIGLFHREEILKRGFYSPKIKPSICLIDSPDDIIVNYDGTLYKCPAFIGWKGLDVGDLRTGIKDYRESHHLDVWKKDECLDCEYLPLCFGGCKYMKLLRDGKIDDVDCKKPYLDATLEAFIKQDIKYRLKADSV